MALSLALAKREPERWEDQCRGGRYGEPTYSAQVAQRGCDDHEAGDPKRTHSNVGDNSRRSEVLWLEVNQCTKRGTEDNKQDSEDDLASS